jgi:Zn-dependent protease with chaperone function
MPTTSIAGRALLGLGLLVGFYVLALGIVAAVVAADLLAIRATGRLPSGLAFASLLIVIAVLRSVFYLQKSSPEDDDGGIDLPKPAEPALWALVEETATAMGTRPPDAIRLVHEVNASVEERARLLGLIPGRRTLRIGVALLQALTQAELRAVLAHEMGHYAGGDTRFGGLTYRGGESLQRAVGHLGPGTLLGRLFSAYARLYFRLTLAVRRRQELTADAAAVRVGGAPAFASALRKVSAAAAAYDFYIDRYSRPLWHYGATAADFYGGYRALLRDPARQEQLIQVIEQELALPADPFDSHPSLAERLAAIADGPAALPLSPGAREVLRRPALSEQAVADRLSRQATGDPVRVDWTGAAALFARPHEEAAHRLLSIVGELDGGTGPAPLGRLLDWLGSADLPRLARAVAGDLSHLPPEQHVEYQEGLLTLGVIGAVSAAVAAHGLATWQVSWAGPVALHGDEGPLAVDDWVREALYDGRLSHLRDRLTAMGVALAWTVPASPAVPSRASTLLWMINDVSYRTRRFDLVLFDDRLALVRAKLSPLDAVVVGLTAGMGGSARGGGPADRRSSRIADAPVGQLLAEHPDNRAHPWSGVQSADLIRRLGGWRLRLRLHDGELVEVKSLATSPKREAVEQALGHLLQERLLVGGKASAPAAA